jgi:hypothetical protein
MRAGLVFAIVAAFPFAARAQDNPACAKFEEPLAYNDCLSKLGPQAHAVQGAPEPAAERGGGGRVRGKLTAIAGKHGRVHMTFDVGSR